ncbi:MAG TPA: hypothetical protein VE093_23820 [Polyangiaceae bacterium]|jgi:hypothetical protein|nr:hypothetical protein [Polyangiaceae bacterium]
MADYIALRRTQGSGPIRVMAAVQLNYPFTATLYTKNTRGVQDAQAVDVQLTKAAKIGVSLTRSSSNGQ